MNQMTEKEAWALLELLPDSSKRDIRRAYAVLAKDCHPEEDPEGFARLQEAYRQALEASSRQTFHDGDFSERNLFQEDRFSDRKEIDPEKTDIPEKKQENGADEKDRQGKSGQEKSRQQESSAPPSLLERLQQEEIRQQEESLSHGALGTLQSLLQEGKQRKKAAVWKSFFLSEEFLTEQLQPTFSAGLIAIVEGFEETEETDLPWQFVAELMLAYGIEPEEDLLYEESVPEEREVALRAWWTQDPDRQEQISRYLARPENQVRLRAFSDYLALRSRNRQGRLTEQEQESWKDFAAQGEFSYLYERNQERFTRYARSECVIGLYAHWIRSEEVPKCVCQFMYERYRLKDLEHSSSKALYQTLKEAILACYPRLEEELFGEKSRPQQISRWYQDLMQVVSDYHNAYEQRNYEESEEFSGRITALFRREEWSRYCDDAMLFQRMYLQLRGRRVLPPTLAGYLYSFYEKKRAGEKGSLITIQAKGPINLERNRLSAQQEHSLWREVVDVEEKLSDLQETMVRSLAFRRRLFEQDYRKPYPYRGTRVEEIGTENQEFWTYYLMTGFDARYLERVGASDNPAEYVRWNCYYLPAYIRSVYLPSLEWAKRFTGFDEEEAAILHPVRKELPLPACEKAPAGGTLQVEFHLHYVMYYVDGMPVIEPVLSWKELLDKIKVEEIGEIERFFFWLAVTAIQKEEREEAQEVILSYLKKLPLASSTLPLIAGALAADNARIEQPEKPEKQIQAVLYGEQERFCFRIEVSLRGLKLYRQTEFGWEETKLLPGEGKQAKALDLEGKKQFAREKLEQLRQPKPRKKKTVVLKGDRVERAMQVIEGLKEQETENRKRTSPYLPGFPWDPEKITPPVKEFFAEYGGWMTEAFVVLHLGEQPGNRFDRIFYSAMNIFGFDLYFHSPDWSSSLRYRETELERKVKEKHLIVGRLGWGEEYEAIGGFTPIPFSVGESGQFYAYDGLHLIREESFPALVARCYDFTEMTSMTIYENMLTVSKLDRRLEYCYTRENLEEWFERKSTMLEETFTKFGI